MKAPSAVDEAEFTLPSAVEFPITRFVKARVIPGDGDDVLVQLFDGDRTLNLPGALPKMQHLAELFATVIGKELSELVFQTMQGQSYRMARLEAEVEGLRDEVDFHKRAAELQRQIHERERKELAKLLGFNKVQVLEEQWRSNIRTTRPELFDLT